MSVARLLLIEDEPALARTLADRLRAEGYAVSLAADGERGLELLQSEPFDLLLLDVMLPGMDGFEVCRRLRRLGLHLPVLMLTARDAVRDRVTGLRLGADDYLTKPFDPGELLARLDALLRRARLPRATPTTVAFADVRIDLAGMSVQRGGRDVELTTLEYQLLCHLALHEGRVFSRQELLREVWGLHHDPHTRTVDVHMTWLRRKLEPDRARPRFLRTVRGAGYKFVGAEPGDSARPPGGPAAD